MNEQQKMWLDEAITALRSISEQEQQQEEGRTHYHYVYALPGWGFDDGDHSIEARCSSYDERWQVLLMALATDDARSGACRWKPFVELRQRTETGWLESVVHLEQSQHVAYGNEMEAQARAIEMAQQLHVVQVVPGLWHLQDNPRRGFALTRPIPIED